jgi:peptidoglycan/LPS O-acetylase OafA/YrhL
MIEFASGLITMGFLVAAGFFARFWRKTHDRLFLAFAIAFVLLALNQALAQWLGAADERVGYTYLLRVLGFLLILVAIIDKNLAQRGRSVIGRMRRPRG